MKIYIVCSGSGEYSDYRGCNIVALHKKEDAEKLVSALTELDPINKAFNSFQKDNFHAAYDDKYPYPKAPKGVSKSPSLSEIERYNKEFKTHQVSCEIYCKAKEDARQIWFKENYKCLEHLLFALPLSGYTGSRNDSWDDSEYSFHELELIF